MEHFMTRMEQNGLSPIGHVTIDTGICKTEEIHPWYQGRIFDELGNILWEGALGGTVTFPVFRKNTEITITGTMEEETPLEAAYVLCQLEPIVSGGAYTLVHVWYHDAYAGFIQFRKFAEKKDGNVMLLEHQYVFTLEKQK